MMKQKIKVLKKDMDRYVPYLYKKLPISKLISNNMEMILSKDIEDELIKSWFINMKSFIRDIKWEIKEMEKELFSLKSIQELKVDMDKYYDVLYYRHGDFFVMLYRLIECILLEDDLSKQSIESYKNVYDSVEIIKEEILRIKNR